MHIAFTYQVVCAPVGAHHLPFTCFATHTSLHPHLQLLHPPKPQQGVRCTHFNVKLGVCRYMCFCSPAGRCGLIGLSCFLHLIQCLQSLHFSLSFLFPCIQPLSAPHTRVAHSLHSTFHHYNSIAIDAHTVNPHLVENGKYQMLHLHFNITIL